ncbi:MAG: ATP-binding protein [Pseudohongiellaceae bacterium]
MTSMLERSDTQADAGSHDALVHREQIDSVFRQLRLILTVDAVSGTILLLFAFLFAETIYPGTYLWFGLLLGSCLCFYLAGRSQIQLSSTAEDIKYRERFLFAMVVISGVIWGSTWLLAPFSAQELALAPKGASLIWLCLMLANATIVLSVNPKLFLGFALPAVILQIAYSLYLGARQDYQIAGALAIILAFAYFMARRIGSDLNQIILLKLRNDRLDLKLGKDEETLRQRESELVTRIKREEALLLEKQDTDNKLAMAAREKLLLLDAVGEGIFGINSTGNITFVNAMALQLLHFHESEVIGENALDLICQNQSETGKEAITRNAINLCLSEAKSAQGITGVFCGKDDLVIPVSFSCRPISEGNSLIGAVVSFADMTNQVEMEAKLLQAQKMEAIGRIAGGVAHDFNNMLTVIMGNLQFLKRRLTTESRVGEIEIVDNLIKASKSGAELNKRLLSFSREQALLNKAEDINSILTDMESFLRGVLGEDIDLHLDLSEGNNTVKLDRTQFENVIVNLCVNAKDAMPDGGKLEISTRQVRMAAFNTSATQNSNEQDFLELTVIDNGIGIPAEIQDKVFDPFFTTKEMGKGSGFGLSTAFGFLQQSGGNISVKSRQGEWTKFTLHLPLAIGSAMPKQMDVVIEDGPRQYSGTILLVEDDSDVRDVATQMLLEAGYTVIAANDGHSGLERFNKHPNIDLVFSDIMMPGGMNGIDMAKRILVAKPLTPILLATGYTQQILKDKLDESEKIICISKPYDTNKLPALINSMLVH